MGKYNKGLYHIQVLQITYIRPKKLCWVMDIETAKLSDGDLSINDKVGN